MFAQSFAPSDFATIATLVMLEALLSADNALVLAMMVRHLPKEQQRKALLYGLGGAFVLRTGAILLATVIIKFWFLQLIGALYLLYLPLKHFVKHASGNGHIQAQNCNFWLTVLKLELVDIAFAIDSVIVAVAVVDPVRHSDKIWVIVAGAMAGLVLLRFAASNIIRLLDRYPVLDHVAFLLVGWAGVKLLLISGHSFEKSIIAQGRSPLPISIPEMPAAVFWAGMTVIAVVGWIVATRVGVAESLPDPEDAELVEQVLEGEEEPAGDLAEAKELP